MSIPPSGWRLIYAFCSFPPAKKTEEFPVILSRFAIIA